MEAGDFSHPAVAATDMDSTRISLARVLELGVRVSWREAAAIVHEAVALTGPTKGARPTHVGPDACLLTRGGDVVLTGDAAKARPETVVRLLEDLLAACDSPGGLAAALERGTAIAFLEELSLRTTPKRRRVEIATVALRGIAAEADRGLYDFDEEREAAAADEADAVPPPLAQITPPIAAVAVAQQAAVAVAPALPAVVPQPSLRVVPPVAPEVPIRPAHDSISHEFDRLRASVKERDEAAQSRFDVAKLLEWLRELDWRKVAAVGVPTVLVVAWWLWPAGLLRLPPTPKQYDPVPFAAIPLVPGWADIDRLGRAPRRAATPVAVADATTRSTTNDASPASRAAAIVAEPPADASVALVPPAGSAPTAAVAAAPPRMPLPAPAETRPVAEPSRASGSEGTDGETVYSWTSQGVEPPVIRSPAMPSWATPPPAAAIDGPYLEVLVDPQGQVETVRVRGRIEPGETFYRHRMMLASAKLWQFSPARLNGRPVRYVTRVIIEQP